MKKKIIGAIVILGIVGFSAHFLYEHFTFVETDNATIQAHSLMIAPHVAGVVKAVHVDENARVEKGQILAEIDEGDYINFVHQAEAELASLQVRDLDAKKNLSRMAALAREKAITQQQFDDAQARYRELEQKLKSADSQVKQAQLNLSYTKIMAPSDGFIAKKAVENGMMVSVGQPLFGFVSSEQRWVTANFKETDLASIRKGLRAEVSVDAVPGKDYKGEVESISASTGATFSLLPPDNATGNFTKVVQRVPVRIRLNDLSPQDVERLQSGLSAVVKIRVR